jgi:hypothetical protein
MNVTLGDLTKATFEPLLHQRFAVQIGDGRLDELELVELVALSQNLPSLRAPFSLVFCGSREGWFHQGTYRLEHPSLGTQCVFLVPIGPNAQGRMQYQAIFN